MVAGIQTHVRLPDPEKIDLYLRDRAAAQKLRKTIRQAYDSLNAEAKASVNAAYDNLNTGTALQEFLTKLHSGEPLGVNEPAQLKAMIAAIQGSGTKNLTKHPGFVAKRDLKDKEPQKLQEIIDKIDEVLQAMKTPTHDEIIKQVFGAPSLEEAKKRFAQGLVALKRLKNEKKLT